MLLSRIAVGAAGGHTLVTLDSNGNRNEVVSYKQNGLKKQNRLSINPSNVLDVIYCVASEDKKLNESLKSLSVPIETHPVSNVFSATTKAALNLKKPLFDETQTRPKGGMFTSKAREMFNKTLEACGGRENINRLIIYNDTQNGPVRYLKNDIDQMLQIFDNSIRKNYEFKKIILDYENLLRFNQEYKKELENNGLSTDGLCNNFKVDTPSFENYMREALDRMELKDGSIIRFLEPGNNEQTTPMFVAKQIAFILEYAQEHHIQLNIQVLIMGMGGHATTALFPLTGGFFENKFSGTTEAESLGETLMESLKEYGIGFELVNNFEEKIGEKIQIKLAKKSKNTGENVQEAINSLTESGNNPEHVFVSTSKASSARQSLTFALQYSSDRSNPLASKKYTSITSIPIFRSEKFIKTAMNDEQAITELYMGLAEECRLILYGFNPDQQFIPASVFDQARLEHIYKQYDLLSGNNAIDKSKKTSLNDILKFFGSCCMLAESIMNWNKKFEDQTLGTKRAVASLIRRQQQKTAFISTVKLYETLQAEKGNSQEIKKLIERYGKLLQAFKLSEDDREKTVLAQLMIHTGLKMKKLGKEAIIQ